MIDRDAGQKKSIIGRINETIGKLRLTRIKRKPDFVNNAPANWELDPFQSICNIFYVSYSKFPAYYLIINIIPIRFLNFDSMKRISLYHILLHLLFWVLYTLVFYSVSTYYHINTIIPNNIFSTAAAQISLVYFTRYYF